MTRRELVADNIRRWSLLKGVLVTGIVLLALTIFASALLMTTASDLGSAHTYQNDHLDAGQNDTAVLLGDFLDQETGERGYLLAGQAEFLQPYDQAAAEIPRVEARLRRELGDVPEAGKQLDVILSAYQLWHDDFAAVQVGEVADGRLAEAQQVAETGQGISLFNQIRSQLDDLRSSLRLDQQASEHHIANLQQRLERLLIVTLAILALGIALTVLVTMVRVVRPLRKMTGAARRVAEGDLYADVPVSGPAEFRDLSGDLGAMRSRLLEEINTARLAGEALRHDSPTVSSLHDALTPRRDVHPDLRTGSRLDPAEGILAGDWYDLLRIGDGLATVVGDVSGHGPRSAVLALGLRKVISTVLVSGGTPGEALAAAAASVADDAPEHFATVFVALIRPGTGTLEYASAGHPAAIVAHADTTEELGPTGPFVSPIVARWSWSTHVQPFRPGDRLLIYTDGVTEGRNAIKEEYGIERLKADLAGGLPDDPGAALATITDNVNRFVGASQTDDRTLVYCQHRVPAPAVR